MFQLFGAARTLNHYGTNTTRYEEKSSAAIRNLIAFREQNNINYLQADDRAYVGELQLLNKIRKIERARVCCLQSTSIGLTNNVLRGILPGPVGNVCDMVSTATRSLMQADETSEQPAVITALNAVAERAVQRECLREVTTAAADFVGGAVVSLALPTAITAGALVGTAAAIASPEIRSSMWNTLQNTVNGSMALGRDWVAHLCASPNNNEILINSHSAIDKARTKLFIKRAEFEVKSRLKASKEANLLNLYTQRSNMQRACTDRQRYWLSQFVCAIVLSDNLFCRLLTIIFCCLSISFRREKHWYVDNDTQLKGLNAQVNRTTSDIASLDSRTSQLLRSTNKRTSSISTLVEQYLQELNVHSSNCN